MEEKEVKAEQLTLEGISVEEKKWRVYLDIPQGLGKEEFQKTIQYFKDNGARYQGEGKWYTTSDQKEKFDKYLKELAKEKVHAANKEASPYIGFAYKKGMNDEKPPVIYGESREEVLKKIQDLNAGRNPEMKYITCSIGLYHPEAGKYTDYFKYDVTTGRNITKIYLQIPPDLSREEFTKLTQHFKSNGAQFSPNKQKKGWYIFPDQQEKFKEYLPRENAAVMNFEEEKPQGNTDYKVHYSFEEPEKGEPSVLQYFGKVENQYIVTLLDGEQIHISQQDVLAASGHESIADISATQMVDILENKVRERVRIIEDKEYSISVNMQNLLDNKCSVYQENGNIIEIRGDQVGIMFSTSSDEDIQRVVNEYMLNQSHLQPKPEGRFQVGEKVTLYVPVPDKRFPSIATSVKSVQGILTEYRPADGICVLENENGKTLYRTKELYDDRQYRIISRAMEKGISGDELSLLLDTRMSPAQMEQIYGGLQDGLGLYRTACYANPKYEAWKMDIYRYGLGNGLPYTNIESVLSDVSATSWDTCRRMIDKVVKAQRNMVIKDLKNHNIVPERRLVRNIENLNSTTGRLNTVDDILKSSTSEYQDTKKEITFMMRRSENEQVMDSRFPVLER